MFYDVITLDPKTYIKKSKKSTGFRDTDEFIGILQKKYSEWNIKYLCNNKAGMAHKIKYDQFETVFLKQSNLIVYVVSLFSEVGFRDSIVKLISTNQDKEKLVRLIVISLDKDRFVELNDIDIDLVHFGDGSWKSEEDGQWDVLKEHLYTKLRNCMEMKNPFSPLRTNAATMPVAIPRAKSSSKFKSFFNSLPAKFDFEKKISFKSKDTSDAYNKSVPNIQISNSTDDHFNVELKNNKNIEFRHKEDRSKLLFTSLFRKRSHKYRDSGLSASSLASNSSDSKYIKNQYTDMLFDVSREPSPSSVRSSELQNSSLDKTKTYKAKIHMFTDKASKYFHSASCLNSPEHKRRKNTEDFYAQDALFSSHQIVASSDMHINDITLQDRTLQRGQSEPPSSDAKTILNVPSNGNLKYYSWNSDLDESKNFIIQDLKCNEFEIKETILNAPDQSTYNDDILIDPNSDEIFKEDLQSSIDSGIVNGCERVTRENDKSSKVVDTKVITNDIAIEDLTTSIYHDFVNSEPILARDNIDENYFQVQYPPAKDNSPRKTAKHSVTFKIDGLDSLENIMESIQRSCDEMRRNTKPNRDADTSLKTFKAPNDCSPQSILKLDSAQNADLFERSCTSDETNGGQQINVLEQYSRTFETPLELLTMRQVSHTTCQIPLPPLRSESESKSSNSILYRRTQTIIENPFVVMGMFTVTAITAPVWSSYIPHDVCIGQILYGTMNRILGHEIIQSIPEKMTSAVTITANVATNSLRRLFSLSSNYLFNPLIYN